MFGLSGMEYHNYIIDNMKTDRTIVDSYKSAILKKEKYISLGEFITKLLPVQTIRIECNAQDKTYAFLLPVIEIVNKTMSIQQAFYELTCEAKLMPVNLSNSSTYINTKLHLEYITRSSNAISTKPDTIDIPLLPNLQYIRVNQAN